MKKLLIVFSITVSILLAGKLVSQDRHPGIFPVDERYKFTYRDSSSLDSFITAYISGHHIAGASACIVKQGNIIWTGNYGWAYTDLNIPIYDSTLFQIASVSKTVTTAVLMRLYEKGRFGLDDSINAYLPFAVRNPNHLNSPITFRMLLTHTSSIRDNWEVMFYYHGDPPLTLRDYLDSYFTPESQYYSQQNFYNYLPGSTYNYCNIGFALAGYLVEALTGIELSKYCRDSLFTQLGMNESSFFYRDLDTMHMAMPYRWASNHYIPYGHYSYHDYPAGALKTSTIQLARFLIAFMQYGEIGSVRILDSTTVSMMITPQIPQINPGQGICWYQETLGNRLLWGHHGGDFGIRTVMFFCPADTAGVLLFTNGEYPIDEIMNEMFNYALSYVISVRPISSTVPKNFKLYQNYPNPFNPVTKIKFSLPFPSKGGVRLEIYDLLGRYVTSFIAPLWGGQEGLQPGTYEVEWDGSNYASGVYFYKLIVDGYAETKKMVLLK